MDVIFFWLIIFQEFIFHASYLVLVMVFKFRWIENLLGQSCVVMWCLVFAHLSLLLQQPRIKNHIVVPKFYNFHPDFLQSWASLVASNSFSFLFNSCLLFWSYFRVFMCVYVLNGNVNFKQGTASFSFVSRSTCLTCSFLSFEQFILFWHHVNVVPCWATVTNIE